MKTLFSCVTLPTPFFEQAGGEGTGGGGEPAPAAPAPAQAGAFLKSGGEQSSGGGEPSAPEGAPEWLVGRYAVNGEDGSLDLTKSMEKQAAAYKELHSSYVKKTDDLKAEVAKDFESTYFAEKGVPEDPSEYAYPETVNPPSEELDSAIRDWAKENNVSKEGFDKLINEVWAKTLPNMEEEMQYLGKDADEVAARVEPLNQWINANVNEEFHPAIERLMTTADGVMFMESIADAMNPSGFAPVNQPGQTTANEPLTREGIRALQADERFGQDPVYTEMVREKWQAFARLPPEKQR